MAAAEQTVIARGAHVRGRVTGDADLEIQGHVEGEVIITGELTVDTHGLVLANLSARRMIVRGAVRGDLVAQESVLLEDGARVVGDVRAPRVSIGQGALVRGYVQTGASSGAAASASSARASARDADKNADKNAAPAARFQAVAKPSAAPIPATIPGTRAHAPSSSSAMSSSLSSVTSHAASHGASHRGAALAGAAPATARRGPPSPVVPALKKGAKGALAKKKS